MAEPATRPHRGNLAAPQRPTARAPPPPAPATAAPTTTTALGSSNGHNGSVRRNLFQSHLTRRPTANNTTSSSSSSSGAETLRLDGGAGSNGNGPAVDLLLDEIVVRDRHGEIELGDEPTHGLDDGEEEEALDERQENERERERLANAARERIVMSQEERQRLGDAMTPTMKQGMEPEDHDADHLDLVKASLRAKVAALDEDNWMFEPEPQPHH